MSELHQFPFDRMFDNSCFLHKRKFQDTKVIIKQRQGRAFLLLLPNLLIKCKLNAWIKTIKQSYILQWKNFFYWMLTP